MITFDGLLSRRIGTDALAGAALAFPWVMLVLQNLVFHAFLLALMLAAIFSSAMLLGAPLMFRWMGGRDEMLSYALSYASVALGGAVCISACSTCSAMQCAAPAT